MQLSATLLNNAIGYNGFTPVPASSPVPGLLSVYNRRNWTEWALVEPTVGAWNWSLANHWVNENIAQGLIPIANLINYPPWAMTAAGIPDLNRCRDFFAYHYQIFGNRVPVVHIGNEYDVQGHWQYGNAEHIGKMAYIAKQQMPGVKIILGSIQSVGPRGEGLYWLAKAVQGYYTASNGGRPDAVGVHLYEPVFPVDSWTARINEVRGVLAANSVPTTEIWVTEFGRMDGFSDMPSGQQRRFLDTAVRQIYQAGVTSAMYWQFDDAGPQSGGFGFKDKQLGRRIWNDLTLRTLAKISRQPPNGQ